MSVCFVAHNAYGALSRTPTSHIGGIERQQALVARWLTSRGWRVSMLTWHEGGPPEEVIDGVKVIKMCRRDAGYYGLRFFHPRWTSLHRALRKADADVYYYNCGDLGLGQLVLWCHRHRRTCVYSIASNADCETSLPFLQPLRERVLYRYGLGHADRVIAQTRWQARLLREGFGVDPVVVPLPCAELDGRDTALPQAPGGQSPRVLWVGRFSPEKRLEWLLDVAERCPQFTFDVLGAANDQSEYGAALMRRASSIPNVIMHGRVRHSEMGRFYRRAAVLCCTSVIEGFPNAFLEAWSCAVPVVTTFDPDNLVASRGLGWVGHTVEELAGQIGTALTSQRERQAAASAARAYYRANHAVEVVLPQFEGVLLDLMGRRAESRTSQ
ncbi:MAG: glycosyltransferase family 4 protein [Phycisphaerae bacterium]|nr:glycosyltransferase family 4 protein [Phycisphaerae bacterium]